MAKKILIFTLLLVGLFLSFKTVNAQNPFDIQFPVQELGNCQDIQDCKTYCDDPSNFDACMSYAKTHKLLSDEKIEEGRQKISEKEVEILQSGGPGECKNKEDCRNYCENPDHIDECADFAEKHGFVSREEALKIKKSFGAGPGGCKGEQCREFCEKPENHNTCIDWAVENGHMTIDQAEKAKKFAGKNGPGGCKGEECKRYCDEVSHQEECLQFAKDNNLIPEEELERAEKFLREGGPGGCKGPRECQIYCEGNQQVCFEFAKEKGFVNSEDEENFKVGQKLNEKLRESGGPGGCKTEEECKNYCSDSSHVEECVAFATAHGGVMEEKAREMLKHFTEKRLEIEGEFLDSENLERFKEEHIKRFEEFRQLEETFRSSEGGFGSMRFQEGRIGPEGEPSRETGFVGPGGCTSPSECIKYCSEHKDECFSFGEPGKPDAKPGEGGIPPGHEFLQIRSRIIHKLTPEEYENCKSNPEICKQYFQSSDENQPPSREFKPCPALPTISECPAGQIKVTAYSSPECGTYYRCKSIEEERDYPSSLPEDQALRCAKYGGIFDGKTCQMPSDQNTTAFPQPTLDHSAECARQGGTWNGDFCKMPEPAPLPETKDASGFLPNFKKTIIGSFLFSVLDTLLLIK